MNKTAQFQINLIGNFLTTIKEWTVNVEKMGVVTNKIETNVNQSITKIQRQLNAVNFNAIVDGARNATELISNISMPGINFETTVADLSAITGIVGKELDGLTERARETGISSGLGARGSTEAYKLLASQIEVSKIGVTGLNMLHGDTIKLAQASGIEMSAAANAMAGTINQFGLQASESNRVINVLAAGSKYGAAEIPELAQSFKVVGAAANAAGLTIEQTAGAVEVLSKNNLKGAEAGTSLRNIILKMQTQLGVDFSKTSLSTALDGLKPKLKDASYLSKLFGMENIAAAQFLITNAAAVDEMTQKVTGTNVAQEQAAINTSTVAFKMAQWRAQIDDVKIGLFGIMGSAAGFITVMGEQAVMVAQMLPLLQKLGTGMLWLTKIQNLQKIATAGLTAAKGIWTGVQWALNAALWACPLTWIIAGIIALVAAIVYCVTCVEGWGKQWDNVIQFAKNCWELFVSMIKFEWNTVVNAFMIGIDYIKIGWYKFKEALGIGDGSENRSALQQINADIEARQNAIAEGAKNIKALQEKTVNSLQWKLSVKKDVGEKEDTKEGAKTGLAGIVGGGVPPINPELPGTPFALPAGVNNATKNVVDLNKITPSNIKGTGDYGAIVASLSSIKMPTIFSTDRQLKGVTDPPTSPRISSISESKATNPNKASHGTKSLSKLSDNINIYITGSETLDPKKLAAKMEAALIDAFNKVFPAYDA